MPTVSGRVTFSKNLHAVTGARTASSGSTTTSPGRGPGHREGRPEHRMSQSRMADPKADSGNGRRPGASLRAAAVSRSFAGVRALQEVTLELESHEVVGLIGPNGAGKSTLVNLHERIRLARQRIDRARRTRHHTLAPGSSSAARPGPHLPAQSCLPRALGPREHRGRSPRRGASTRGAPSRRRAARPPAAVAYGDAPAATLAHGDERRLGVGARSPRSRASYSWTSRRPG